MNSVTKNSVAIQTEGRRHYLVGDTYPIRNAVRAAGCKWDAERKAWWTGRREIAEGLLGKVSAGEVRAECSWRKVGGSYLVAVPAGTGKTGDTVTVRAASGSSKRVQLGAEVQPGLFEPVSKPREQRQCQRLPRLVGEESPLASRYEASRDDRTPGREIGSVAWLRHGGRRIAVVLVGYSPAQYIRQEDAEDMGYYDMASGYYGYQYWRAASRAEYEALQASKPREDGVCAEGETL